MKDRKYEQDHQEGSDNLTFRQRTKDMSFEKKMDYILTYYWGRLIIAVLVPIALVVILCNVFKPRPDFVFSGNCSNVTVNEAGQSYLINDLNALLNMEPGELELKLSFAETAGLNSTDVDTGLRILASVAADQLDYILCDSVAMEYYSMQGAFLPVDQVLSEQTLEAYAEQIYYFTDEEEGISYAAGVDVSAMPFVRDCVSADGPVYFMFANMDDADTVLLQTFWSHLESWEAE